MLVGWEMGTSIEAHLSYYAIAYNMVETNQLPQDLFISKFQHHK